MNSAYDQPSTADHRGYPLRGGGELRGRIARRARPGGRGGAAGRRLRLLSIGLLTARKEETLTATLTFLQLPLSSSCPRRSCSRRDAGLDAGGRADSTCSSGRSRPPGGGARRRRLGRSGHARRPAAGLPGSWQAGSRRGRSSAISARFRPGGPPGVRLTACAWHCSPASCLPSSDATPVRSPAQGEVDAERHDGTGIRSYEGRVIRGWLLALDRGDYGEAAHYFSPPERSSTRRPRRLRDESAARAFNASLPCRAKLAALEDEAARCSPRSSSARALGGSCSGQVRVRYTIRNGVHGMAPARGARGRDDLAPHEGWLPRSSSIRCRSASRLSRRSWASRARRCSSAVSGRSVDLGRAALAIERHHRQVRGRGAGRPRRCACSPTPPARRSSCATRRSPWR